MQAATIICLFIAMLVSLLAGFFPIIMMSGKRWNAAQDRARARRMAEYKMNARLLRLNI
jgi:uncharacterized membrane protein